MHFIFFGITNMARGFISNLSLPAVGSLTMKALSFLIFLLVSSPPIIQHCIEN